MQIAHVISVMSEADGHSVYCARLSEALAARGHACAVCCRDERRAQPLRPRSPVAETRLPPVAALQDLLCGTAQRSVARFLEERRPDLVHVHGLWHPLVHAAAACARRRGLPYVTTLHGMARPLAVRHHAWRKHLAWFAYQRRDLDASSAVHALSSQEAADPLCRRTCAPVRVVPMGVVLPEACAVRAGSGARRALYLGRMHAGKGLDLLLDAWRQAQPAGWELVLAGPDEDECAARLRRKSAAGGAPAGIRWQGAVYGAEKDALLATAELLVLPSPSESFGAVVGEALARGIPAIATRGAPWEELQGRACGWWVHADTRSLAQAIVEATALTPEQRAAMGSRGRALMAERYRWEAVAIAMERVYRQALGALPEEDVHACATMPS